MILALDIGTSSTRALLFDALGHKIGAPSQIEYSQKTTHDGGVECDAPHLFELTANCIDRVLEAHPEVEIAAVATSCFWHSLVATDQNHRALTPLFSWADNRSAPYVAALRSLLDEDESHARTGCVLHTSYWPAKLLWLGHTQPELFALSTRCNEKITWLGFGEWMQAQLFGNASMSLSMASGTGLFHQNNCDWDDEVLEVLPVSRAQLPLLTDCNEMWGELLPEYQKRWPQLARAKWFPAVGDGACSNIGSACVDAHRVALNVGTSGALRVVLNANEYSQSAPRGLWRYRIDRKRILLGGAVSNAGSVWAWCKQNFALPSDVEAQMLAMQPDAHGLTILPFLAGERSPLWNGDARFVLEGASLDTTPVDIARAALEASSLRFAAVFELLQEALQEALQTMSNVMPQVVPNTTPNATPNATSSTRSVEVVASGGALSKSPVWSQIVADCLGVSLSHSTENEASARGAALLALESLGVLDLSKLPAHRGATVNPNDENHTLYRRALERQNALYQKIYG